MKWSSLKPSEIRLLIITGVVVFVFLNYVTVIPWWKSCQERSHKLAKDRKEMNRWNEVLAGVEKKRLELRNLEKADSQSSPNVENPELWQKHFLALASQNGVEVTPRSQTRANKLNPNELTTGFIVRGSWENVVKFLVVLQNDASRPHFQRIKLAPAKPGDNSMNVDLETRIVLIPAKK